jgi:hypothetical protein
LNEAPAVARLASVVLNSCTETCNDSRGCVCPLGCAAWQTGAYKGGSCGGPLGRETNGIDLWSQRNAIITDRLQKGNISFDEAAGAIFTQGADVVTLGGAFSYANCNAQANAGSRPQGCGLETVLLGTAIASWITPGLSEVAGATVGEVLSTATDTTTNLANSGAQTLTKLGTYTAQGFTEGAAENGVVGGVKGAIDATSRFVAANTNAYVTIPAGSAITGGVAYFLSRESVQAGQEALQTIVDTPLGTRVSDTLSPLGSAGREFLNQFSNATNALKVGNVGQVALINDSIEASSALNIPEVEAQAANGTIVSTSGLNELIGTAGDLCGFLSTAFNQCNFLSGSGTKAGFGNAAWSLFPDAPNTSNNSK